MIKNEHSENESDNAVIKIRHLKKSFGKAEVLRDINLQLQQGENVAVMGRSGQGKSVTIKCIVGLLEQDGGSVEVLGKEVKQLDEQTLRALRIKVGFLFQSSALYDSMTVRENLEFPLIRVLNLRDRKDIDSRVQEVLEGVGLEGTVNKLPSELSGGMRKRIALARTLILKPEIMLYDEPTTGLDPITSKEISELILDMRKRYKTSSLIITHDLQCARITADRMMVMDNGVFVADGTYQQLKLSDNELVRSFFE